MDYKIILPFLIVFFIGVLVGVLYTITTTEDKPEHTTQEPAAIAPTVWAPSADNVEFMRIVGEIKKQNRQFDRLSKEWGIASRNKDHQLCAQITELQKDCNERAAQLLDQLEKTNKTNQNEK